MSYTPKIDKLLDVATELGFGQRRPGLIRRGECEVGEVLRIEQARVAGALGIRTWSERLADLGQDPAKERT